MKIEGCTEKIKRYKHILNDKDVVKRLHINGDGNCFLAMKDHKENFENKPSVKTYQPGQEWNWTY